MRPGGPVGRQWAGHRGIGVVNEVYGMRTRDRVQGPARGGKAAGQPDQVVTFAQAWSVLRSSSASRAQKARLVRMFGAALAIFAAAGLTAVGGLV